MSEIALIGTGSDGTSQLWDSLPMQKGNHLRWFIDTFPELGFEVFRRKSKELIGLHFEDMRSSYHPPIYELERNGHVYVTIQMDPPTGDLIVDASPRGLRIPSNAVIRLRFQRSVWYMRLGLQPVEGKEIKIHAILRGETVFTTRVISARVLDHAAELDQIKLDGDGWMTLFQFDFPNSEEDWQHIASLCLPVTHVRYPSRHSNADGTINGDETEAKARLPQAQQIIDRYIGALGSTMRPPFRDELHPELIALATNSRPPEWIGASSDPKLENINHLAYILLLSLDPYIARILGLYYVDEYPAQLPTNQTHFDYKVEGHWLQDGESQGELRFSEIPNIAGSQEAWHRGFTLTSSVLARLERGGVLFEGRRVSVKVELPPFKINRIALFGEVDAEFSAVITFGEDQSEKLALLSEIEHGEMATFEGLNVTNIEITGSGKLLLKTLAFKAVTEVTSYSAYTYHVSPFEPQNQPSAPKDLRALELKGWALSPPPGAVGLNAVGLQWTPDVDFNEAGEALVPPTAALVAVEWRGIISGSEPFKRMNEGHPILAMPAMRSPSASAPVNKAEAERRRQMALEFLIHGNIQVAPSQPQPPVDPLRYIYTRLKDGMYEYRLLAIDVFGRISPPGNVEAVELKNQLLPPTPILLAARYIQQDDPKILCMAVEDTWLENHNTNGLRIMWAWPPALYHRAPKALSFKIYGPSLEAQSVTVDDPQNNLSGSLVAITSGLVGSITQVLHLKGEITAVEEIGKLVYHLTTNATLPDGYEDAFIGAGLMQHVQLGMIYKVIVYKVIGHTDGPNVALWIERQSANPKTDPSPRIGAFALDHSLMKTNVVLQRGVELLVGGEMVVNGNKSAVINYNGGSEFLVQHDSATPPTMGIYSLLSFASGGILSTIKSVNEDFNTQTSRVEVDLAIPAGGILVGGVVESGANSFEILENTSGDAKSRKTHLTLRWIKAQTTPKVTFNKPQIGPCRIKGILLATLEADRVLPGLDREPKKVGGWIEQDSKEFNVLGFWENTSSTNPTARRTYFLVSHRTGESPPLASKFTYNPAYEVILQVPFEVSNVSIVDMPTSLDAKITDVKEDAKIVKVTTNRDLVCSHDVLNPGTLQSDGNTYNVKEVISLAPLTVVIDKPGTTTPLPSIDSPCNLSILSSQAVIVKTNKAKAWRWFAGGVLKQGTKEFLLAGYAGYAVLIVMKAPDGSAPTLGAFTYRPVSDNMPTAQGWVSITSVDHNGESAHSVPLLVTAVYRRGPADFTTPELDIKLPSGNPYPVSVPNPPCLEAKPADWYGRSFYTLEWNAELSLLYHVYRAVDASLYDIDREKFSQPRTIAIEDLPKRIQDETDLQKRDLILDAIQQDFDNLDVKIAAWRNASINEKAQRLAELELAYKNLRNDTHEVLANMPYTASAFTLLTKEPINSNRTIATFRDEVPGRSSNRFFYRIIAIDKAGNRSNLSPASPPICCPDMTPPKAPVITRVLGGDRQITIYWASNREEDLKEYRIYRADREDMANDLRLMTIVHIETGPAGDPPARPPENAWQDVDVVSGRQYWYRIIAVDTSGNVSPAAEPREGRACRLSPPPPPTWVASGWNTDSSAVHLEWLLPELGLEFLIQRRADGLTRWQAISGWISRDTTTFDDTSARPTEGNYYRIKARDEAGNISVDFIPRLVAPLHS